MTRRSENSGLIDLDALMREASVELPAAVAVVGPPTETHSVAEATLRPPPPPLPPNVEKLSDDSLEAMTSGPDTNPGIVAPPPRIPGRGIRSDPTRRSAIGIAMVALVATGAALVLRTRGQHETAVTSQVAPPRPVLPKAAAPIESTPPALRAADLPAATPSASAPLPLATKPAHSGDIRKGAVTVTETVSPSPTEHGDLGSAMRGAVGASDAAPAATIDEPTGTRASQLRPSPGAVVGAIGAVMPSARACLGPNDSIRNGLVVFKSDGSVARVEVRGAKPEDDCVRSALAKAKVAPFVDDTFSTRVTVRP